MELLLKIKNTTIIFLIISIIILLEVTCSKSPVKFENPNDPNSKIYIESKIDSGYVERTGYSSGNVKWVCVNPDKDIEVFHIYRSIYSNTDSNCVNLDVKFIIPSNGIEYNNDDSLFFWSDTTLIFNNKYKYRITQVADGIESLNDIEFDYFHGFITPCNVNIEQTSDTSLSILFNSVDALADSVRITWLSSGLEKVRVIDENNINMTFQWSDGGNSLEANQISIDYSYTSIDTVRWINVISRPDITILFPPVKNLSGVLFNNSTIRLIWQYPYPSDEVQIEATSFIIRRGGIAIDSVLTTQQILDETYFVYYCETNSSSNFEFEVIPKTKYHDGNPLIEDCTKCVPLSDDYQNYTFVDTSFDSKGVYINNYEVCNDEFCNWAKENTEVEDFSTIDFVMTDFDSTFNISIGRENYPVRGIPYLIAEKYAFSEGAEIPSDRVWMLAASASVFSTDYRDYPWGNDSPGNKANYQMNHSGPISVGNLSDGRVKINQDYNIWGPYNMAGNVMEWVADTISCFGGLKKISSTTWYNCKGGNWRDGSEYLLIWENYCQPADYSDEVIGFRLMKR